ncbi:hypothetical protein Cob_v003073 [Colletotrichum orbiculare MAFF 240422]|uniref:Uncharacterized protein n=1 Tax=Colletotrichum orbiculare (strain 104-T / ATCC 96160 / CBS 514.97 / LARS 414 / MAFF 240422) TaxID=1213857 RepID=A0A484G100_COLOR|nr:hypothetical protein Cob_v003073 [Colletotrichum orbiculare MAFF 240422]
MDIEKVKGSAKHDQHALAEDSRGRFRVWAANIGALLPVASSKSLDTRVKNSQLIKVTIISGLERIITSSRKALQILSGELQNQRVVEEDSLFATTTDELRELLLSIESAVGHLFELSILLRRERPRGRTLADPTSFASDSDIDGAEGRRVEDLKNMVFKESQKSSGMEKACFRGPQAIRLYRQGL